MYYFRFITELKQHTFQLEIDCNLNVEQNPNSICNKVFSFIYYFSIMIDSRVKLKNSPVFPRRLLGVITKKDVLRHIKRLGHDDFVESIHMR